jgi:hypothetical protein
MEGCDRSKTQPPTESLQTASESAQLPPPHIRPFVPTEKLRKKHGEVRISINFKKCNSYNVYLCIYPHSSIVIKSFELGCRISSASACAQELFTPDSVRTDILLTTNPFKFVPPEDEPLVKLTDFGLACKIDPDDSTNGG